MEDLDVDSQQRRKTFARYGLAMYHAQCVEKTLALLTSSVFHEEFQRSDYIRRGEIQDEVFAETIGRLLKRLREQVAISDEMDARIEEARKKRNWLAHDYFWDRAAHVMITEGRAKMIDELTNLADFYSELDANLMSIVECWCEKIGMTKAWIEERMKELRRDHE